jgi:hypothetical protein
VKRRHRAGAFLSSLWQGRWLPLSLELPIEILVSVAIAVAVSAPFKAPLDSFLFLRRASFDSLVERRIDEAVGVARPVLRVESVPLGLATPRATASGMPVLVGSRDVVELHVVDRLDEYARDVLGDNIRDRPSDGLLLDADTAGNLGVTIGESVTIFTYQLPSAVETPNRSGTAVQVSGILRPYSRPPSADRHGLAVVSAKYMPQLSGLAHANELARRLAGDPRFARLEFDSQHRRAVSRSELEASVLSRMFAPRVLGSAGVTVAVGVLLWFLTVGRVQSVLFRSLSRRLALLTVVGVPVASLRRAAIAPLLVLHGLALVLTYLLVPAVYHGLGAGLPQIPLRLLPCLGLALVSWTALRRRLRLVDRSLAATHIIETLDRGVV